MFSQEGVKYQPASLSYPGLTETLDEVETWTQQGAATSQQPQQGGGGAGGGDDMNDDDMNDDAMNDNVSWLVLFSGTARLPPHLFEWWCADTSYNP